MHCVRSILNNVDALSKNPLDIVEEDKDANNEIQDYKVL